MPLTTAWFPANPSPQTHKMSFGSSSCGRLGCQTLCPPSKGQGSKAWPATVLSFPCGISGALCGQWPKLWLPSSWMPSQGHGIHCGCPAPSHQLGSTRGPTVLSVPERQSPAGHWLAVDPVLLPSRAALVTPGPWPGIRGSGRCERVRHLIPLLLKEGPPGHGSGPWLP